MSTPPLWRLLFPALFVLVCFGTAPARVSAQVPDTEGPGSNKTLKIGATLSLSGPYREPSAMIKRGYELWVRNLNTRGGLLGRPVELIVLDDKSDPELTRRGYRRLLEEYGVELVLSPYSTPLTTAASEVTEEAGYVMIASGAAGRSIWNRGYDYIFGIYATADRFFIGFLDLVARQGLERVGILHETNPFNRDAALGAAEWAGKFGLTISGQMGFYPSSFADSEYIQRLKECETEVLVVCSYPDVGYVVLEEMTASDWRPAAVAMTITAIHPEFHDRAGSTAEGIFAPSQWEPMERIPFPGNSAFIENFRSTYRMDPSYHAASAYATGQILERAVRHTGGLDHERIRRFILSLDTVTIIGRFKVDAAGKQVGHNPLIIQWQDGRKEIVYPRLLQTASPRFERREEERKQ